MEDVKKFLRCFVFLKCNVFYDVDEIVDMICYIIEFEKDIIFGVFYWDCFKGVDFCCIEIVCVIWSMQNFLGNIFSNYVSMILFKLEFY